MPVMHGGGAERVAMLLLNEFQRQGHQCEFLLTNDTPETIVNNELNTEIPLFFLGDYLSNASSIIKCFYACLRLYSSLFCRIFEFFKQPVPAHFAYCSFISQYYPQIIALRNFINQRPNASIITFLQPSIPMVMLASRGLPNRVVFSERGGNAGNLVLKRYGFPFIRKYYSRADAAVFQTQDALAAYPKRIAAKGYVISNPIKSGLPAPFCGVRRNVVTTFCRISREKNLMMLLKAFSLFHKKHPDYQLHIIGNPVTEDGFLLMDELKQFAMENHLETVVSFLPFSANVHQEILEDAMYVNCSDYEGMSNAMLEAMAIGLPVICTDCPIGGARQTIRDHENGLLVPVNDLLALSKAMHEIIQDRSLSTKMSLNGAMLRESLNVKVISKEWLNMLE